MESVLLEFVDTLDTVMKKIHLEMDDGTGLARLTVSQFHYIDAINQLGEPSATELAEKLKITRASVTTAISKLVLMGYVNKSPSVTDRRAVRLRLSEKGERLVAARVRALHEYGELIRAALSAEQAAEFEQILTHLVAYIKKSQSS
jgi:DNA-binding MarR family transcriptional regulator